MFNVNFSVKFSIQSKCYFLSLIIKSRFRCKINFIIFTWNNWTLFFFTKQHMLQSTWFKGWNWVPKHAMTNSSYEASSHYWRLFWFIVSWWSLECIGYTCDCCLICREGSICVLHMLELSTCLMFTFIVHNVKL